MKPKLKMKNQKTKSQIQFKQIKLSGCPTKGHFTEKSGKNAFFPLLRRFGKFFGGQSQKLSDI